MKIFTNNFFITICLLILIFLIILNIGYIIYKYYISNKYDKTSSDKISSDKTYDKTSSDKTSSDKTSDKTSSDKTSSDKTSDKTSSDKTSDKTSDNTSDKTSDITSDKTSDNTSDKTSDITSDKTSDDNSQKWLKAHEKYRKGWSNKPLIWDEKLAIQAQNYAKTLSYNNIQHGDMCGNCSGSPCLGGNKCGQNLRAVNNMKIDPESSVDSWYSECSNYNKVPTRDNWSSYGPKIGHYSQVMWKNTDRIGCAIVDDVANCLYDSGNTFSSNKDLSFEGNLPDYNLPCK